MAIVKKEQRFGKWEVRWQRANGECIFSKFPSDPTLLQINDVAQKYENTMLARQQEEKRVEKVTALFDSLRDAAIQYLRDNPAATVAQLAAYIKGLL